MKTRSYKDLIVWQKSMKLVINVYSLTKKFPQEEIYGLTSQIRRSAVSVPSNIAEGYSRQHGSEYIQFLSIAYASAAEFETQLLIAQDLGYGEKKLYKKIFDFQVEVSKMLISMIYKLRSKNRRDSER